MIRVSAGTAAVLGLRSAKLDAAPTTAYLMCGQKCSRSCAFCSQAHDASSRADLLSRVTWPEFDPAETATRIATAYESGEIERACIQVVLEPQVLDKVRETIGLLREASPVPLCVSANGSMDTIAAIFTAGADRVSIPLDAACDRVYRATKGTDWERTRSLLFDSVLAYPGRVGTHLIVGLGETDEEFLDTARDITARGVNIALFAFTPIKGSKMEQVEPPPLNRYRAIQAAVFLMKQDPRIAEGFAYVSGRLSSIGLSTHEIRARLISGDAFRTSGCPGCNRPYYNEKPGGDMYNYPRPLSAAETAVAIDSANKWLDGVV